MMKYIHYIIIVVIYCVYTDDTSGTFTINSSTGHIILSDSLDREATSSYDITVTVSHMYYHIKMLLHCVRASNDHIKCTPSGEAGVM